MSSARRPVGKWVRVGWLFPVTYGAHILEEWRGGEGFPAWFSRVMGTELSVERFLALNAYALAGMTLGVVLIAFFRQMRWLLVSFGAVVFINALAHLLGSAVTLSYSPGAVSGTLLWLPLGAWTLQAARGSLSRRDFTAGMAVGVVMHAAVTLLALFGS